MTGTICALHECRDAVGETARGIQDRLSDELTRVGSHSSDPDDLRYSEIGNNCVSLCVSRKMRSSMYRLSAPADPGDERPPP